MHSEVFITNTRIAVGLYKWHDNILKRKSAADCSYFYIFQTEMESSASSQAFILLESSPKQKSSKLYYHLCILARNLSNVPVFVLHVYYCMPLSKVASSSSVDMGPEK